MHVVLRLIGTSVLIVGTGDVHVVASGRVEYILLHVVLVSHATLLLYNHRQEDISKVGVALAFTRRIS